MALSGEAHVPAGAIFFGSDEVRFGESAVAMVTLNCSTLSKWEAPRAAVVFNVGVRGCPQLWSTDVPAALIKTADPERAPGPPWVSEASGRVEQHLRR